MCFFSFITCYSFQIAHLQNLWGRGGFSKTPQCFLTAKKLGWFPSPSCSILTISSVTTTHHYPGGWPPEGPPCNPGRRAFSNLWSLLTLNSVWSVLTSTFAWKLPPYSSKLSLNIFISESHSTICLLPQFCWLFLGPSKMHFLTDA